MGMGFEAERHTPVQLKSEYPPGGTAPLTKNWHVLYSISNLSTPFSKIIYASYSELSKELKNGVEILVGQVILSYGSKQIFF